MDIGALRRGRGSWKLARLITTSLLSFKWTDRHILYLSVLVCLMCQRRQCGTVMGVKIAVYRRRAVCNPDCNSCVSSHHWIGHWPSSKPWQLVHASKFRISCPTLICPPLKWGQIFNMLEIPLQGPALPALPLEGLMGWLLVNVNHKPLTEIRWVPLSL